MELDLIFDLPLDMADQEQDFEAAWEEMCLRSEAIAHFQKGFLNGTLTNGEINLVGDLLAEQGIDPYAYADQIQDNIGLIIARSIPITL